MVKVAPSILAANFMCLEKELKKLEKAQADYIHFDVMDGHFVDNITFGPQILKQAKKCTNLLVLIMSVNPGFGGQQFDANTPKRIENLRKLSSSVLIEVDGGINKETAKLSIDAGADILVAGTSVFKTCNYEKNIKKIKGEN